MSLYRVFAGLCFLLPMSGFAKPATLTDTSLNETAVEHSRFYRFESVSLTSTDQQRHYQVTVATPKAVPPEQGYPVLYMLDGNKVLAALTEQHFSRLQEGDWPVIVTLGYESDAKVARSYDYTPPLVDNTLQQYGRKYGGAELFGQFLEQVVKPKVAQHVAIDSTRQSLWGHSFGGLFVLHSLFNHPDRYQSYIAVDPSLWWQQGQILTAEQAYRQRLARPIAQLLIQRSASQRAGSVLGDDATRRLAQRLSELPELNVQYYDYFQHHHGSVRAASIPAALRIAQGRWYE